MEDRKIIATADGSHTIELTTQGVTYHSVHGAVQESVHIFIRAGLQYWKDLYKDQPEARIFEMGLGTGLNALLTFQYALANKLKVSYHTTEVYPLSMEEVALLNYSQCLNDDGLQHVLYEMHQAPFLEEYPIHPMFQLYKTPAPLQKYKPRKLVDVIYFDAFAPDVQPELWTQAIFDKMYHLLTSGGVLVTYCAKGSVRRNMLAVGFRVEKLAGPPGKREMLRAVKS